jgi:hypothetical protein
LNAFERDFEQNGPSLARLQRVLMAGWQKYKHHPQARIRKRFEFEVAGLKSTWAGAVWAMRKKYRHDRRLFCELTDLLRDIYREFGWKTRLIAPLVGRYLMVTTKLEEKRLARGWTMEPGCFYEKNPAVRELEARPRRKTTHKPEKIHWAGGAPTPVGSLDN